MTASPLFWKFRLELKSEVDALLGEGGRQKLGEKLADYTRKFVLGRKRINAVGDAAGELAVSGLELLDVEGEANHGADATKAPGEMQG